MIQGIGRLFSGKHRDEQLQASLVRLRQRTPVPLFWLFGKTQSGKTSVIKYLTGATDAEIGQGFQPCTRFSRLFQFPSADAPLLTFLDTRGIDEPGYDPQEDLERFGPTAHVIIVTVKVLDHAQENVLRHLHAIHAAQPSRPIVLLLTCLHEAYPQQQHPQPYPFSGQWAVGSGQQSFEADGATAFPQETGTEQAAHYPLPTAHCPLDLVRSIEEQRRRFEELAGWVVPVDLTRPEDGFDDSHYGGEALKRVLLQVLPTAYRQTLITLEEASHELKNLYLRQAMPHIVGYSVLAGTAGAVPIPWVDLLILPGIQTRMVHQLAHLYGQPQAGARFLELASTLGLGMLARQAVRELLKFVPYVGAVAGAVLAGASTYALGKAFCYYFTAVHQGHVPPPEELRHYYQEQLAQAERSWSLTHK